MEFQHRGAQAQSPQTTSHVGAGAVSGSHESGRSKRAGKWAVGKWLRIASVVLLFSVTILVISIASLLYYGNSNESGFINNTKFQAVDLNIGTSSSNDQIYFGQIKKLNDKYLVLQNIYYIVPNQAGGSSSNNYTLVKLGCELHAPYDQMVINRDHVIFWENLKTDGTVAQKIAEYQKQNPNGPNCAQQNAAAAQSSAASNAASTQTSLPTTTTTKKP